MRLTSQPVAVILGIGNISKALAENLGRRCRIPLHQNGLLLNHAGGAQTAERVGAACEATYLSIQETVEHRNHKTLRGRKNTAESLVRQARYVHKVVVH